MPGNPNTVIYFILAYHGKLHFLQVRNFVNCLSNSLKMFAQRETSGGSFAKCHWNLEVWNILGPFSSSFDPEQLNLCLLLETVSQFVLSLSSLTIVKEEVGRGWYNLRIYSSFECVTDLTTFEIYYEI